MPELDTSLRARFFFADVESQGMCGFPEDSEKEECIRLLTEVIEDAECYAEQKGHSDWDFKVMDLVHAQMHNEKLMLVSNRVLDYLKILDTPDVECEDYAGDVALRLKWLRESVAELRGFEQSGGKP